MILNNFVVFEGIDGAGTSTQLKILQERPESAKIDFSAEPTSFETGKFLRSLLCGKISLDPRTTAYLFAADRAEHVYGEHGIENSLKNGKISTEIFTYFSKGSYFTVLQCVTGGKLRAQCGRWCGADFSRFPADFSRFQTFFRWER